MSDVQFSKDEMDRMVAKVKTYFSTELDQEIGAFDAEFLIEFITKEIGPRHYNLGLADAQALFTAKTEERGYLFQDLEKITT